MAKNEKSSEEMASLAGKTLKKPAEATDEQVRSLAASVLTQAPDKPKPRKKKSK